MCQFPNTDKLKEGETEISYYPTPGGNKSELGIFGDLNEDKNSMTVSFTGNPKLKKSDTYQINYHLRKKVEVSVSNITYEDNPPRGNYTLACV